MSEHDELTKRVIYNLRSMADDLEGRASDVALQDCRNLNIALRVAAQLPIKRQDAYCLELVEQLERELFSHPPIERAE